MALGGVVNVDPNESAQYPSLAINNTDTPYVTWREEIAGIQQIYVKQWNGSGWVQTDGSLNVNPGISAGFPSLDFDGSNSPYVAWHESNGTTTQIFEKHWNGSAWEQDGASLNVDINETANKPSLGISGGGVVRVTWSERSGSWYQIYAKHWNGSNWEQAGGSLNIDANNTAGGPSLPSGGLTPYITWTEDGIYVKHWNGSNWAQDGGNLNIDANELSSGAMLAISNSNTPYVTWNEFSTLKAATQIYVKYLGPAVSPTDTPTTTPTFTITPTATPTATATSTDIPAVGTPTFTRTATRTRTVSATYTITATSTRTSTPTPSPTITPTLTISATRTISATITLTSTITPTLTPVPDPRLGQGGGYAVPNPFFPHRGQWTTVRFSLPAPGASFKIRILNVKGRLVRTLENTRDWDGRNNRGRICEGGLYLYQIVAEGGRISGTVVLMED